MRLGDIDSHQVDPDDFHEDNHQHHLDDQDGSQVGCFLQEEEPLPPTPLHQVVLLIGWLFYVYVSMPQLVAICNEPNISSKTIVIAIILQNI